MSVTVLGAISIVAVPGAPGIRIPLITIPRGVAVDSRWSGIIVVPTISIEGRLRVMAIRCTLHGKVRCPGPGLGSTCNGAAGGERKKYHNAREIVTL
jgi:hypothetical protein